MFAIATRARKILAIACLSGAVLLPPLAHATSVNSATWNTFYDSIEVMKAGLPLEASQALTEDIDAVDDYYLGQYEDGIHTQLGDLKFKEALSGLSAGQIHKLAIKLSSEQR